MVDRWIKIYAAQEEYVEELIKSLLENNRFHSVLLDKKDDGFKLAIAEIHMATEEAEKANEIIEQNQKTEES